MDSAMKAEAALSLLVGCIYGDKLNGVKFMVLTLNRRSTFLPNIKNVL